MRATDERGRPALGSRQMRPVWADGCRREHRTNASQAGPVSSPLGTEARHEGRRAAARRATRRRLSSPDGPVTSIQRQGRHYIVCRCAYRGRGVKGRNVRSWNIRWEHVWARHRRNARGHLPTHSRRHRYVMRKRSNRGRRRHDSRLVSALRPKPEPTSPNRRFTRELSDNRPRSTELHSERGRTGYRRLLPRDPLHDGNFYAYRHGEPQSHRQSSSYRLGRAALRYAGRARSAA